jgi:adenosylmethionine-8-amino-7-oxononanoate aminotransferase
VLEQVEGKAQRLRAGLEEIRGRAAIVGDIRNRGLMFGLELVADAAARKRFDDEGAVRHFLVAEGLRQGLLMIVGESTVNLYPPLTITDGELDELVERLGRVVATTEARFLGAAREAVEA